MALGKLSLSLAILCWASPAAAVTFLLEIGFNSLRTIDLAGAVPVIHGPFQGAETFGGLREVLILRDEPVAILRADLGLFRIDLADPLAPAITASMTPPFTAVQLISAGPRDYFLLLGPDNEIAVVDSATLAVRRTFLSPGARGAAALSPGGSQLVSVGRSVFGWPGIFLADFDPDLGLGPESMAAFPLDVPSWPFFSPDGKSVTVVRNDHSTGTTQPSIETFEVGPAGLEQRQTHQPASATILDEAYGRGGGELVFLQITNPPLASGSKLLRFAATGPGQLEEMPFIPLGLAGVDGLVRTGGGHLIVFATHRGEVPNLIHELCFYRPADGSLQKVETQWLMNLKAFETNAAVFADGFESGDAAAWDVEFP
jgi:hypothetical protein